MSEINITSGGAELIVVSEPIVVNDQHYVFTQGSKVVGKIKGTFDFSELPDDLHMLAAQMILGDNRRVCLAIDRGQQKTKPTDLVVKPKWSWRRLIGLE